MIVPNRSGSLERRSSVMRRKSRDIVSLSSGVPRIFTWNSRTLFAVPSNLIMFLNVPICASTSCNTVALPLRAEGLKVASAAVVNNFFHCPWSTQALGLTPL